MFLSLVLSLTGLSILAQLSYASIGSLLSATQTCISISQKISNASAMIYALDPDFLPDIDHWFLSSTQIPACVLEVGAVEDVATALQVISSSRTPFAVKSGGHASNPGFSSTNGVHISMVRMNQVVVSPDNSTVEIGMGMTWAGVYERLGGSGVNVVGGRTPGPGVGGFTLGGGFSWKTSHYGLTVDNVKSLTTVLPNGTISQIDSSQPDLFFALKGGLNRFGIVTSVEYCAHQQAPLVYGGIAIYPPTSTPSILAATASFKNNNTDSKAQIITTLSGSLLGTTALVIFFYDGPTRPASFAPFNNITTLISTVQTQSFSSFVSSIPSKLELNARGTFNTLSTSGFTLGFLSAVKNETDTYGAIMDSHSGTMVSYDVEPFLSTYGQYSTDSAFPHSDSPLPLNLYFAWISEDDDAFWYSAMRSSAQRLKSIAMQEGIYRDDYTAYPNYAITNTSAQELYGPGNAARLATIRAQVDPGNVMELAGGFTI